ncbi:hypothetical protein [Streptomyces sp. NPDC007264]|uniref:hypothetical protein n=1 Tax=Streptomyces sp. NPDC007264 TaxID=3364777 RepID=UPI0036D8A6EC
MPRNLAELAHAALTAGYMPDTDGAHSVLTRLDSTTRAVVADVSLRDNLGFVLLFHRRRDGHVAEELYASTRLGDGSWARADHLSGGVTAIGPAGIRYGAGLSNGRSLVPFGESETCLFTGRPQADDGYELLRFHELLVEAEADHLNVEGTSPETGLPRDRIRKSLVSPVALFALFPGERITVRAMVETGTGPQPLGEPYELTGP